MLNKNIYRYYHFLWYLDFGTALFGFFSSLVLQYFFLMSACFLCVVARYLWFVYAICSYFAYLQDQKKSINYYLSIARVLRFLLVILAIFHLLTVYNFADFCISPTLLALHGGWYAYLAKFDLRNCANEPIVFLGFNLPLMMLYVYLFWELLDMIRSYLKELKCLN